MKYQLLFLTIEASASPEIIKETIVSNPLTGADHPATILLQQICSWMGTTRKTHRDGEFPCSVIVLLPGPSEEEKPEEL